jgi:hypothetical protein
MFHVVCTGIALNFVKLRPERQEQLVGSFLAVANNHYDTDGVLAAFALTRPQHALPRSERMLAAAATGDFGTWHGPEALAVELTVTRLTSAPASPLAARMAAAQDEEERWAAGGLGVSNESPDTWLRAS